MEGLNRQLSDLASLHFGPLKETEPLEVSSVSSVADDYEVNQQVDESTWVLSIPPKDDSTTTHLLSWANFYDASLHESRNEYISEQGSQVYDSILASQNDESGQIVQPKALLKSLLYLGLGRESILYEYNEELESFHLRNVGCRMSGCSYGSFQSFSAVMVLLGNATMHLRSFISDARRPGQSSTALSAVAGETSSILSAIEADILDASTSIHSLLQLQALFEHPRTILECLNTVASSIQGIRREELLLSCIFDRVQQAELGPFWIQAVLFQVLVAASKAWIAEIGDSLGLSKGSSGDTHSSTAAFIDRSQRALDVKTANTLLGDEYQLDPSGMPSFISNEDAQLIIETRKSIQLLREHQHNHPLVQSSQWVLRNCPGLEWRSSWQDIEWIADQAKLYELNVQDAIRKFQPNASNLIPDKLEIETTELPDGDFEASLSKQHAERSIQRSIAEIEGMLSKSGDGTKLAPPAKISDLLVSLGELKARAFAPPVSLLPSLSFRPIIAAQARLANQACLRLLFKYHNLQSHISILHRYCLLGDGIFASQLSHALFNPDLGSTGRKGFYGVSTSGLKLGYREAWPPASSELRLTLMGILTESYFPTQPQEGPSLFRDEIPGGLSFAFRTMSEEELQNCTDPNSINALDFLRLQYQAPPPINAVISVSSLEKYDALFKLLLRAKRMQFAVDQLSRDLAHKSQISHPRSKICLRFRTQSCHFVSAVCAYFYSSVAAEWTHLERKLKYIESVLDKGYSNTESVSKLCDVHEHFLDRLTFTLLLRKRHAEVMKLLEDIFGLILRFMSYLRTTSQPIEADLSNMYAAFQTKVKVFINVCRGLSERRGYGGTKSKNETQDSRRRRYPTEDGHNKICLLLLNFEMNDFYTR